MLLVVRHGFRPPVSLEQDGAHIVRFMRRDRSISIAVDGGNAPLARLEDEGGTSRTVQLEGGAEYDPEDDLGTLAWFDAAALNFVTTEEAWLRAV